MKPSTKRALATLLSKEWVSGNELFLVAGTRYGARLDELKEQGYRWDKRWMRGSRVPQYRLILPDEQLALDGAA
jgi:biotin operon repressor